MTIFLEYSGEQYPSMRNFDDTIASSKTVLRGF